MTEIELATQLREALEEQERLCAVYDSWSLSETTDERALQMFAEFEPSHLHRLADAARTIALPILEQDQELVERIAIRLLSFNLREPDRAAQIWEGSGPIYRQGYLEQAHSVLAVLVPEDSQ